jgi:hypothetical protein
MAKPVNGHDAAKPVDIKIHRGLDLKIRYCKQEE